MFRRVPPLPVLLLLCGGCALGLAGLGGCSDSDRRLTAELDEPDFRRAQELGKAGRNQEALLAYQKVIARRGEDAPESHLELGLLYLQHIKDPIPAIYHFNEYVRLRPNSPQASFVRQRIDAARREFARTLPAQPLENQFERLDLLAAMDRLKQENEMLKEQLAALRAGRTDEIVTLRPAPPPSSAQPAEAPPPPGATGGGPAPSSPVFQIGGSGDAAPTVRARSGDPGRSTSAPAVPTPSVAPTRRDTATPTVTFQPSRRSAPPPAGPPSPAASAASPRGAAKSPPASPPAAQPKSGRTHTVMPGDTLMGLAQRYYGSRAGWRRILEANRDQLPTENAGLRVGTKLKIP